MIWELHTHAFHPKVVGIRVACMQAKSRGNLWEVVCALSPATDLKARKSSK